MLKYEKIIKATLKDIKLEAPQYLGYYYLIYCINYIMESELEGDYHPAFMNMYKDCAEYYNNMSKSVTGSRVERGIRFYRRRLLNLMSDDIRKKCTMNDIITNSSFLYGLVDIVREKANYMNNPKSINLKRVEKEEELYFLLTNGNGFANAHDIVKTAKILNKTDIDEDNKAELIKFAKTLPGVKYVYSSEDLTPENFLKYGQKYLAIRFCTKEFGISIVEAKNLIESVLED